MQRVLVGEADGAVRLVRDAGADAGRLADAHLGHGDLEARVVALGGAEGRLRGDAGGGDVAREHREALLDRLKVADGLAELLALGGIPHGLRQARIERTGHLGRARHRSIQIDGVRRNVRRPKRDHARIPEDQRVARLEGEVPLFLDRGGAARDQRDGEPPVQLADGDDVLRVAAPRHPRGAPADGDGAGAARERQALVRMHGCERHRSEGHREPGPRQQPARDDRLRQRHRRLMPAGGSNDDVGVEPGAAGAAGVLGDERQREAALFQRAPELVGPGALLGGFDQLLGGEVGEEPGDGVAEQGTQFRHLTTWGAPTWSPTPPITRSAPGNPWRSSVMRTLIAGPARGR